MICPRMRVEFFFAANAHYRKHFFCTEYPSDHFITPFLLVFLLSVYIRLVEGVKRFFNI